MKLKKNKNKNKKETILKGRLLLALVFFGLLFSSFFSVAMPDPAHQGDAIAKSQDHARSYLPLMRFAIQQLYAPQRLLEEREDIYRIPMQTSKTIALVSDGSVSAWPLAAWRMGQLTVTAVRLENNLDQLLSLDPRQWCGAWLVASLYPNKQLSPKGDLGDTTTVFLITDVNFKQALKNCT